MLITELQRGREGQAWRLRGQAAIKQTETEKLYIRTFYELDLSGSLKCLEFLDPVDMGIVLAILQLLIASCSLGDWLSGIIGLVTRQPQPRTCHKHFHARVEGHRSMSSWLERILLYWIYMIFWLLFLFQVSFVDLWIISSMCQI